MLREKMYELLKYFFHDNTNFKLKEMFPYKGIDDLENIIKEITSQNDGSVAICGDVGTGKLKVQTLLIDYINNSKSIGCESDITYLNFKYSHKNIVEYGKGDINVIREIKSDKEWKAVAESRVPVIYTAHYKSAAFLVNDQLCAEIRNNDIEKESLKLPKITNINQLFGPVVKTKYFIKMNHIKSKRYIEYISFLEYFPDYIKESKKVTFDFESQEFHFPTDDIIEYDFMGHKRK